MPYPVGSWSCRHLTRTSAPGSTTDIAPYLRTHSALLVPNPVRPDAAFGPIAVLTPVAFAVTAFHAALRQAARCSSTVLVVQPGTAEVEHATKQEWAATIATQQESLAARIVTATRVEPDWRARQVAVVSEIAAEPLLDAMRRAAKSVTLVVADSDAVDDPCLRPGLDAALTEHGVPVLVVPTPRTTG
jgi:hypothetical protein